MFCQDESGRHPAAFARLAKADLVETHSGASGGSRLKKKPEEISLWEIYQTVESSAAFSVHQPLSEGECKVSRNIESVLINIQNRVDKAVWKTLCGVTLAEVLQMLKDDDGAMSDEEFRQYQENANVE